MPRQSIAGIIAILCTLILTSSTWAGTIYVDDDAPAGGDGVCWATAYRHLQDALTIAEAAEKPVEVRVAQGVYKPDTSSDYPNGTGDRTARFYLLDDVTIKGGFAGFGAVDPNFRDPAVYETFLSGDLAGDDVYVPDPRDLYTEPTRKENSFVIVAADICSRSACLDGFVIHSQNSNYAMSARPWGAGVELSGEDGPCCPLIRNCTVLDCADMGMFLFSASPELADCAFVSNAQAIHITHTTSDALPCDLAIMDCLFSNNCANGSGAAIEAVLRVPFQIENCVFVGNVARTGGAAYVAGGQFVNCRFLGNKAVMGGAIYTGAPGIHLDMCTFVGNRAEVGHALASPPKTGSWLLSLTNSILWDGGSEIAVADNAELSVAYNDIQSYWPGQGNIDLDPCFVDPGYWDANDTPEDPNDDFFVVGDYHLKSQAGRWDPASESWVQDDVTSPCIDAGDPNASIMDEPFPNAGIVNMGAYGGTSEASKSYFGEPVCETIIAGDINGDCKVDINDLLLLISHWTDE